MFRLVLDLGVVVTIFNKYFSKCNKSINRKLLDSAVSVRGVGLVISLPVVPDSIRAMGRLVADSVVFDFTVA
jgi:hypothetical protein